MAQQRMSTAITKLARKRGRLPALIAALAVTFMVVAQQFLFSLLDFVTKVSIAATLDPSELPGYDPASLLVLSPTGEGALRYILPFVLGVFVGLWLLAPLSHELGVRFVVTRSALAAAAGGLMMIVVNVVIGLVDAVSGLSVSGTFDEAQFGQAMIGAGSSAMRALILYTPMVVLAGIVLWIWLRDHPREYDVSGLIDEV